MTSSLFFYFTCRFACLYQTFFAELYCHSGLSFLFTASLVKAASHFSRNCIVTWGFLSFSPPTSQTLQIMFSGIVLSPGTIFPFHCQPRKKQQAMSPGIVLSLTAFFPFHCQPRKKQQAMSPGIVLSFGTIFPFHCQSRKSCKPCLAELYCHLGLSSLFTANLGKAPNHVSRNCIVIRGFLPFSPPTC